LKYNFMNEKKVVKENFIKLQVGLDEQKMPATIHWSASETEQEQVTEAKAFLLSIFDKEYKDTLKIDLWTHEMQVVEMDKFMYQTLRALAETYYKATNNVQLSNDFMRFVQYFGEKTEILPKGS